ncbi:major facilitator superfamily domain-containing protein [Gigaspora rosea]|uniref:Major facilitator superfamily domain-containing protein n=1 Tax=Gigaspora rosea TaxID=44941 RepID=A0A397UCU9_9GLOM|nr:major facilitator superfamily domain-containing protein [Gigaspora rosea]
MTFEERTEKGITDYEITSTTNQDAASYDSYTFKVMEKRVLRKFDIFILRLGFHVWIPIIMVVWAGISMSQAAVSSAVQLGIVRFFLGADEAGFSPAAIDYICLFYARKEITLRYGIFMALAIISGAFTGLLVSIWNTSNKRGCITRVSNNVFNRRYPNSCSCCNCCYFLYSGPGNARFLTRDERTFTIERLRPEGGVDEKDTSVIKSQTKSAFYDPRVYGYIIAATAGSILNNVLNYFLPTLVKQLGYSSVDAQLMSVPPFLIATVVMLTISWLSDKYQRNITIATGFTFGNIGDVIGILLFPLNLAPSFTTGTIVCLSMMILQFVVALIMKFHLEYENKRRDLATLSKHNVQLSNSELKHTKLGETNLIQWFTLHWRS